MTLAAMIGRLLGAAIYALTSAIGVVAFLYPFVLPTQLAGGSMGAHSTDAPLLLTALVALCFGALLLEVQGQALSAKLVALLGVLVALNAVLRFVELALPGPGGFSPIFGLIVLTGYVYGGRFGFLMGALTMLVSALITGGVGPWLPYQMFAAGWVGLSAPLCRLPVRLMGGFKGGVPPLENPSPLFRRSPGRRREVALLACFAAAWGLLYGLIMNLWFWPFVSGLSAQSWQPGLGLAAAVQHYVAFYLATSLVWDLLGAAGNLALILAVGAPTLQALRRFRRRFAFDYQP